MTDEYPPWQVGALMGTISLIGGMIFIFVFVDLVFIEGGLFGLAYALGSYLSWSWYYKRQTRRRGYLAVVVAGFSPAVIGFWGTDVLGSTFLFAGLSLLVLSLLDWIAGLCPVPSDDAVSSQ